MSDQKKEGIYVYQPFGVQHPDKWESGRIYGIGGLPMEATCHGLTKDEAEAVRDALAECRAAREQGKETVADGDEITHAQTVLCDAIERRFKELIPQHLDHYAGKLASQTLRRTIEQLMSLPPSEPK